MRQISFFVMSLSAAQIVFTRAAMYVGAMIHRP